MITLKNIDHFVIVTKNLEACLHFYVDILGMQHVQRNGHHSLKFGSQKINIHMKPGEFAPFATDPRPGTEDFCLIAEGEASHIKEDLEAAGCTIVEGVVERNGALGKMDSVYVRDPDGNLVEIAVYR